MNCGNKSFTATDGGNTPALAKNSDNTSFTGKVGSGNSLIITVANAVIPGTGQWFAIAAPVSSGGGLAKSTVAKDSSEAGAIWVRCFG